MESLDPEPLRRRSRLRALHARRESGRSFGSGSAVPVRGCLILANEQTTGKTNRTLETEVNSRNQHLRHEVFAEAQFGEWSGKFSRNFKGRFANRTARSNWCGPPASCEGTSGRAASCFLRRFGRLKSPTCPVKQPNHHSGKPRFNTGGFFFAHQSFQCLHEKPAARL
jgi:hypothetical protein